MTAPRKVLRINEATKNAVHRDHYKAMLEQEAMCRRLPGPNVVVDRTRMGRKP